MRDSSYLFTLEQVRDELITRATGMPAPSNAEDLVNVAGVLTNEINRVNGFPR
jgi:hypothetical protein